MSTMPLDYMEKEIRISMMNRPTFSDVYDINPKTGALILGKNRLDDYATKFLNKYCKKHWIHLCHFQ